MSRVAFVVGAAGQDGQVLSAFLRARGVDVVPFLRSGSVSIADTSQITEVVRSNQPDWVYYLPAHHHSSEEAPVAASDLWAQSWAVHVQGAIHFLEAIRQHSPRTRFFYAASSHVFGAALQAPQSESTPFRPLNAYGVTKVAGIEACRVFRAQGVFASTGILYTHESVFRSPRFLAKRVVQSAVRIRRGSTEKLKIGDLEAVVDWGDARDTVEAMALILQAEQADDFVVATGQGHTVREYVEIVFQELGLDWREHVQQDSSLLQRKMPPLIGDSLKLRQVTGWKPKSSFRDWVTHLVRAEER